MCCAMTWRNFMTFVIFFLISFSFRAKSKNEDCYWKMMMWEWGKQTMIWHFVSCVFIRKLRADAKRYFMTSTLASLRLETLVFKCNWAMTFKTRKRNSVETSQNTVHVSAEYSFSFLYSIQHRKKVNFQLENMHTIILEQSIATQLRIKKIYPRLKCAKNNTYLFASKGKQIKFHDEKKQLSAAKLCQQRCLIVSSERVWNNFIYYDRKATSRLWHNNLLRNKEQIVLTCSLNWFGVLSTDIHDDLLSGRCQDIFLFSLHRLLYNLSRENCLWKFNDLNVSFAMGEILGRMRCQDKLSVA